MGPNVKVKAVGGICTLRDFFVIDQFGYLHDAPKIAVIPSPLMDFDSDGSFSPGATYSLVDSETGNVVLSRAPEARNGGNTEARFFSDPNNADKDKDVSGGWYDAGD